MKKCKNRCLQAVLMTLSLVAVCNSANAADNIVEVADKAGTFTTLLKAAEAAGLAQTLQEEGPFTVFAPTDEAFAKLPNIKGLSVDDLFELNNKNRLAKIIKHHIVSGRITAKQAEQAGSATTLAGDKIRIALRDGRLVVNDANGHALNDANVVHGDVEAANGIIHVIDSVIISGRKDIVESAKSLGRFKTWIALVEAAGLTETLKEKGPFTVFMPSDEAFGRLEVDELVPLLEPENKQRLRSIIEYHLIPKRLGLGWRSRITAQGSESGLGQDIENRLLRINQSEQVFSYFDAANGALWKIDKVLLPPAEPDIFATDEVPFGCQNLAASFGLVHELDLEKIERGGKSSCFACHGGDAFKYLVTNRGKGGYKVTMEAVMPSRKDIVHTLESWERFKTLITLAEAAGLTETLKGKGPFTLLAPTDEAFGKLGVEKMAELLKPENKQRLRSVLEYHLIPKRLSFDEIGDLRTIQTTQGSKLRVQPDPPLDRVLRSLRRVDQSGLLFNNIDATNGVVHVINTVLLPPAD